MSKSKTSRRKDRPAADPGRRVGARASTRPRTSVVRPAAVRPGASPSAMGLVAVAALVAAGALIAAGGGIPAPTPKPSTVAREVVTATVGVAGAEGSVEPTLAAMQKLSSLVTCAGEPCPSKGSPNAPVTLIEVSDFTCTHCADFNRDSAPVLEAKYVDDGRMRLVAHVFAYSDASRQIAGAALCANEQDGYFAFQREAFDALGTEAPDRSDYMAWAGAIGLNLELFADCVDEQRHLAQVDASTQQALDAGISATPSFVLNGLLTEGNPALDEYTRLIEAAIEAAGETS